MCSHMDIWNLNRYLYLDLRAVRFSKEHWFKSTSFEKKKTLGTTIEYVGNIVLTARHHTAMCDISNRIVGEILLRTI